jgi:RNA polymerase sigma factor (sigma-70 family)
MGGVMVEVKTNTGDRFLSLLSQARIGDRSACNSLVILLAEECRGRGQGKRYFPISIMREACRHYLKQLALDPDCKLMFYEIFSEAILSAMAVSAAPEVCRLGSILQETILQLSKSDPTKTLLLRLQYIIGLNWDEIRALPSAAEKIAAPEKAFVALGAELQARGLSPEILVQQNLHPRGELTHLLEDVRDGERSIGEVVAHERPRLHRQAEQLLKLEGGNISLQADDLVNEMFLRMPRDPAKSPANHMEFEALAKRIMRHVLIDRARKPIPGQSRYSDELREDICADPSSLEDNLLWSNVMQVVNEVIIDLRRRDPEGAAILRATLYSDVDQKELATLYEVSVSTVKRRVKEGRDRIRNRLGLESKR